MVNEDILDQLSINSNPKFNCSEMLKKRVLKILLIILVLSIPVFLMYKIIYIGRLDRADDKVILTNSTSDWETYTNTQHSYSIKYPESLLRLVCPNEELTLVDREDDVRPGPIEMPTCARGSRYTLEVKTYESVKPEPQESEHYTIDTKNIILGGLQGKQYTFTFTNIEVERDDYLVWFTQAVVNKDGKTFEIYFDNKDLSQVFDQILSTFKFIN